MNKLEEEIVGEKIIGGGGLSDLQVFGSSDLLVSSSSGPLFSLFSDLLVFWSLSSSPGLQVSRSSSYLVFRSSGP